MGIQRIVVTFPIPVCLRAKKPIDPAYPVELKTLGDHLRKTRLDRGLSQGDVAIILEVGTDTVTTWETNRHQPTAKFAKSIISFLGYAPFNFEGQSIGRQLYCSRLIGDHTQKQVAELIGCDASILRCIELDQINPLTRTCKKIQDYLDGVLNR